jgi:hypothetical protein
MSEVILNANDYELLQSISRMNGGRSERIVEALSQFPLMYALPPTEELLTSWYVWEKRQGRDHSEICDPIVQGGIYDGEFVAFAFTRQEFGRNAAILEGRIHQDQTILFEEQTWATALYTFLANGYAGVCIDPGTDHMLQIPREELSRIVALMTIKNFAGFEKLALVKSHDGSICHSYEGETQVMVFDCDLSDQNLLENLKNSVFPQQQVQIVIDGLPTVIQEVLHSDAKHVVVNPGLSDTRLYEKEELKSVFKHRLDEGVDL